MLLDLQVEAKDYDQFVAKLCNYTGAQSGRLLDKSTGPVVDIAEGIEERKKRKYFF